MFHKKCPILTAILERLQVTYKIHLKIFKNILDKMNILYKNQLLSHLHVKFENFCIFLDFEIYCFLIYNYLRSLYLLVSYILTQNCQPIILWTFQTKYPSCITCAQKFSRHKQTCGIPYLKKYYGYSFFSLQNGNNHLNLRILFYFF